MEHIPTISLCIPTNGVTEWVIPVLDSIYCQNVDLSEYEVIVTDNGQNPEFKEAIGVYTAKYPNLVYKKTDAAMFLNQIEAFKLAKGELIKFVNHRALLKSGTLKMLISFTREHMSEKPVVYFSNGVLKAERKQHCYENFDQFVNALSYWSSWSAGIAMWKQDFNKIPDKMKYNPLFPHTTLLFQERNRRNYIIDDTVITEFLPEGDKPKGTYDLFFAFSVEYPAIILDLYRDGSIRLETYQSVLRNNLDFVTSLYLDYILRKKKCSYDLSGYDQSICVFYSRRQVIMNLFRCCLKKARHKLGI